MYTSLTFCAVLAMGFFVPPAAQKSRSAGKRPLPPIPSLETALLPSQLASEMVQVEILKVQLARAIAKFGENSIPAETARTEIEAAWKRIDRLDAKIDKLNDDKLRLEAETLIQDRLRHYREGLTMTQQELMARAKREREEVHRKIAELERSYPERVNRLLAEYNFPPKYNLEKSGPAKPDK